MVAIDLFGTFSASAGTRELLAMVPPVVLELVMFLTELWLKLLGPPENRPVAPQFRK